MAKHFINGQWVPAASGQTLPVIDPATGETFDTLARGDARDIDRRRDGRPRGTDGRLGPHDGDRARPHPDEDERAHPRARRGARAARGARHRQADEPGAQRHPGRRALLRVLRRRGRQGPRRADSLPERLPRRRPARAVRRDGAHPAVELPGADVRPLGRAGAGDGQRRGAEAVGGRLPDAAGLQRDRARRPACPTARSTWSPASARRPARP